MRLALNQTWLETYWLAFRASAHSYPRRGGGTLSEAHLSDADQPEMHGQPVWKKLITSNPGLFFVLPEPYTLDPSALTPNSKVVSMGPAYGPKGAPKGILHTAFPYLNNNEMRKQQKFGWVWGPCFTYFVGADNYVSNNLNS